MKEKYKGNEHTGSTTLIEGCGLALLSPYLTTLFSACKLLREDTFINEDAQLRGIALLHYIIYGTEKHKDDEQLIVPCLLCNADFSGYKIGLPKLSLDERLLADAILFEINSRCSRLKHATAQVIRENFIQRKGRFSIDKNNLNIEIKKRIHDVLLGSLPNESKFAELPWMGREVILNWVGV